MTEDDLKSLKRFLRHQSKTEGQGMARDSPWIRGYRDAIRTAIAAAEAISAKGPQSVEDLERVLFGGDP